MAHLAKIPPERGTDAIGIARASGSVTVLTLAELASQLPRLQPPVAYRLSLDSGIEYKNVRRAFTQPRAARLGTWQRLLRSLRIRLFAAASAEDIIWPGAETKLMDLGGPGASMHAAPCANLSLDLRGYRQDAGWSRRELARRAGLGLDAVASLEQGGGMTGNLERACAAFGLQLLVALPPGHATLETLWAERAGRCLDEPAQFPPARPKPATPVARPPSP